MNYSMIIILSLALGYIGGKLFNFRKELINKLIVLVTFILILITGSKFGASGAIASGYKILIESTVLGTLASFLSVLIAFLVLKYIKPRRVEIR